MDILILALLAAAGSCTALDGGRPRAAAHGHIAARQDEGATITLGERDNYLQSPTATASPTGTQLRILPTDISEGVVPEGGLDIFFGGDLTSSLSSSLEEHCGDGASEECINSLVGNLNDGRSAELEARVLGVDDLLYIGVAALVALMATLIEQGYVEGNNAPTQVHLPSSDVVQLQSQTGSSIPIVTSSGADVITIPAVLPSTTVEGPATASIYTLTADDANGHSSGVSVVAVPTDVADTADQLLAMAVDCPHNSEKKRQDAVDYGGVNGVGGFLLRNAAPGELLNAFGLVASSQLPRLRDEAAQASWDTLRALADTLPDFEGVSDSFKDAITTANWQAAYQWCIQGLNDAAENLYFEESLWGEGEKNDGNDGNRDDNDDNDDPECLADAPRGVNALRCDDEECKEIDGLCSVGDAKKCLCLPSATYEGYRGTEAEWGAGQYILESLQSEEGAECDDELVTLDREDFESLASAFCSDVDLESDVSKELTASDIDSDAYARYTFLFEWKKKDSNCGASCEVIYQSFASGSRCTFASHTFAKSGYQDLTCGEASFEVMVEEIEEEPEPEPEPEGPTKQVAVLSTRIPSDSTFDWLFLLADYEQGVECRNDYLHEPTTAEYDEDGQTYPRGTWPLDLTIDDEQCEYRNDGNDNPGEVVCGDRRIRCEDDPNDEDNEDPYADKGTYDCGDWQRQPVFVCPY